jgi:hypothetical protein
MAYPDVGEWGFMEAGWYVHPILGGLCKETADTAHAAGSPHGGGWYFWPVDESRGCFLGPFKTRTKAIVAAEKHGRRPARIKSRRRGRDI